MLIREAVESDIPEIVDILNHDTSTNPSSWHIKLETLEMRQEWFRTRQEGGYPILVAEGSDGRVMGYASCGQFRRYDAWQPVVEHSIYLHADARGAGLGKAMLDALITATAEAGFAHMVAVIDGANEPSLRLHRSRGFTEIGRMDGVGKKPGEVLDAVFLLLELTAADAGNRESDDSAGLSM